jgi:hypothetical protein
VKARRRLRSSKRAEHLRGRSALRTASTTPMSRRARNGQTTLAPATTRSAKWSGIVYVNACAIGTGSATSARSTPAALGQCARQRPASATTTATSVMITMNGEERDRRPSAAARASARGGDGVDFEVRGRTASADGGAPPARGRPRAPSPTPPPRALSGSPLRRRYRVRSSLVSHSPSSNGLVISLGADGVVLADRAASPRPMGSARPDRQRAPWRRCAARRALAGRSEGCERGDLSLVAPDRARLGPPSTTL